MEPVAGFSFAPPRALPRSARPPLALLVSSLLFAMGADIVAGIENQPADAVGLAVRVEAFVSGGVVWSVSVATGLLLAARVQLAGAAMWLATSTTMQTRTPGLARRLRASGLLALCGLIIRWSAASLADVAALMGTIVDGVLWSLCIGTTSWALAHLWPDDLRKVGRAFAFVVIAALGMAWLHQSLADLGLFDATRLAERVRLSTIAEFDGMTTTGWRRWTFFVALRLGLTFLPSSGLAMLAVGAFVGLRAADAKA